MANAHFLCQRVGVRLKGLTRLEDDSYRAGPLDLPLDEARQLEGGTVHFHEARNKPSVIGGEVTGVEGADGEVTLRFEARKEARRARWKGWREDVTWYSGVLDG